MKKYIVGFLAGAVFAISATAFADTIPSLVGKVVQAQYTVEVNGKVLNTVVVDGSNYAPVRAFSDAAGYNITAEGKNVKLSEVVPVSNVRTADEISKEIAEYESMLTITKSDLERVKNSIDSGKFKGEELEYLQKNFTRGQNLISSYEKHITDLQAQLAELQGQ